MIPLARELKRGVKPGADVQACKRGLRHWEASRDRKIYLKWPPDSVFGDPADKAVRQFQKYHGMSIDGVLGKHTYAALWPWIAQDAWAVELMRRYYHAHTPTVREAVVAELRYWLNHHSGLGYAQVRPVPIARFREHLQPVYSDCSGSIIGCNFAAGAPDPSGNGYNGQGWTGDFISHLKHIDKSQLRPGDIIVYGWFPGVHAVAVLKPGSDPQVYSHGHAGDPDDPRAMPESSMNAYFNGVGVYGRTYCSLGLP